MTELKHSASHMLDAFTPFCHLYCVMKNSHLPFHPILVLFFEVFLSKLPQTVDSLNSGVRCNIGGLDAKAQIVWELHQMFLSKTFHMRKEQFFR